MTKVTSNPSGRYQNNYLRNDKEAQIMKQFSEEYKNCQTSDDIDYLIKKYCEKLGGLTQNEFYKKQIIWGGEYPSDIKAYEELTYEDFYTGKTKQLDINNEYYNILQKISTNNNIPIGEIDLEINLDKKDNTTSYTYLRYHPRYQLDMDEILNYLHAKIERINEDSMGYVEYKLIIQDQKFEEILYQGQEEVDNIEFDEKDYEWLWNETYEEHKKKL